MEKKRTTEFWLCLFLGWLGVHRFYVKKYATGLLWMLTGGLLGLGWLLDTIRILMPMVRRDPAEAESQAVSVPEPDFQWTPAAKAAAAAAATYRVSKLDADAIRSLAYVNPDYDLKQDELIRHGLTNRKIWHYIFTPKSTQLVPEPNNPQDPYAIRVLLDGVPIGYVKASVRTKLLKQLQADPSLSLEAVIRGGPYRVLYEEYAGGYTLQQEDRPFFVTLGIKK